MGLIGFIGVWYGFQMEIEKPEIVWFPVGIVIAGIVLLPLIGLWMLAFGAFLGDGIGQLKKSLGKYGIVRTGLWLLFALICGVVWLAITSMFDADRLIHGG